MSDAHVPLVPAARSALDQSVSATGDDTRAVRASAVPAAPLGYETVSLGRALGLAGEAPLPQRPLVLTFDDGTLDFWEHARPVLDLHGFSATLFVVTGHVGGESGWDRDLDEPDRPLMSWDQLRELDRAGYEIGSQIPPAAPRARS